MEHLELHVINSPRDIELAIIAGLIDEFEDDSNISCTMCDSVVLFDTKTPRTAFILLSEERIEISCETCLTAGVEAVMVR